MPSTVILGTARTPFGKMGGGLSTLDATDLGGTVIEAALDRPPFCDRFDELTRVLVDDAVAVQDDEPGARHR